MTADGSRLAIPAADGTVRVYLLDPDELVRLAEERLSRTLTDDECLRYLDDDACL